MNDLLRILLAVLLVLHAFSHLIWFLATWTSFDFGIEDRPWVLPGNVRLKSWVGKVIGIVALAAMFFLLFATLGLLAAEAWWRAAALYGVLASVVVVLPWWPDIPRRVGLQAVIADIVLLFVIVLPLSTEILSSG